MSAFEKSNYTCPACKKPLLKLPAAAGRVLLWCGWGPCRSVCCNDGEMGETEQQAYEKLLASADAEASKPVRQDPITGRWASL